MTKLAISHALAQSVKTSLFEELIASTIDMANPDPNNTDARGNPDEEAQFRPVWSTIKRLADAVSSTEQPVNLFPVASRAQFLFKSVK